MPGRKPLELFEKALQLHRDSRGTIRHAEVARQLQISRHTAKHWYTHGFRKQPPIQETMASDKAKSRALAAVTMTPEDKQSAKEIQEVQRAADAPKAAEAREVLVQAEELKLADRLRRLVLNSIPGATRLVMHADTMSQRLEKMTEEVPQTPQQIAEFQQRAMRMLADLFSIGRASLEVERLRRGDPSLIVEIRAEDVSVAQLEQELGKYQADLQLVKQSAADDGGADAGNIVH